ncbi:MAG: flagellar protein FlaG [Spirochaetia bacterium]
MSTRINRLGNTGSSSEAVRHGAEQARLHREMQQKETQQKQHEQVRTNKEDIQEVIKEIEYATTSLNKKLKFSINRDLGEVVVKVVDGETDKVIKEIPPEALQRLHVRLKEAIGLLFDESI